MALYSRNLDVLRYGNKRLKLNLSYGSVLKVFDLQKEELLTDTDKIDLSLENLVFNFKAIRRLPISDKNKILETIYTDYLIEGKKSSGKNKKLFDFVQDEKYIYASFMSCYGIDLYDVAHRLHWKKFMALFKGLTDDAKIKEIMSIRGREIPVPTKYNQDEIKNLRELKAYYALGGVEDNYHDGLGSLFDALMRMAK